MEFFSVEETNRFWQDGENRNTLRELERNREKERRVVKGSTTDLSKVPDTIFNGGAHFVPGFSFTASKGIMFCPFQYHYKIVGMLDLRIVCMVGAI